MIRFCYNANGLRNLDLAQAVRAVASAGYEGVELSLHPRHIEPYRFTSGAARELRTVLRDSGVEACCLATGADNLLSGERFEPSLIHPTSEGRTRRIDLLRRAIDLACWLEVPVINFASGIRKPEVSPEDARKWLLEGIQQCVAYAAGRVVLAIEPEPGFFVQTNGEAAGLVHELGSSGFRINQDIGHANVSEPDYLASIGRALPLTAHIHVEDIKGRVHRHEIPGEGDIDFPSFFDVLRRSDYRGFLSVELYNHGDVYETALKQSLSFLKSFV